MFKKPSPKFDKEEIRRELRRDAQEQLRQRIKELRAQARQAKIERDEATRKAKEKCRARVQALFDEADRLYKEAEAKLRQARNAKKQAAREECQIEAAAVQAEKQAAVELLEKKRDAEIAWRDEQDRSRKHMRGRERDDTGNKREESDQEVEWNLEADDPTLVPVFQKIRRSIKPRPDMSRTESFLEWVSKHESEVAAMRAAAVPSDDEFAREFAEHQRAPRRRQKRRVAA